MNDYVEKTYAGVLGKIIGVYLGRPFEQWAHKDIVARLGEVNYYVHEKLNQPLIVTDDDISGTFTFIRALEDNDYDPNLSAAAIGNTWLNYIIRNRTILWWGGMGVSTEHTAFKRLLDGIEAPRSGSIELNGPVVAEQIGAQIFIDGWGLVNPGDPERAAAMARKAGSVSHDGEALHGAVVVAAMVAGAFTERKLDKLLDTAVGLIPVDCTVRRVIDDLRDLRAKTDDWYKGLELIHQKYSYEKFGGGCHMIPNHAVIQLGLLWGNDSFQRSLMVTNTAGYDTDCNSGNVGCIMAVKNGLASINAEADFRTPVADRLMLPTADGGSCMTDAVIETDKLLKAAARLRNGPYTAPKGGSRFHFSLPGSLQGFSTDTPETCRLANDDGRLAIKVTGAARVTTQTFVTPAQAAMGGYSVFASPTVYPGQTITAKLSADAAMSVRLIARHAGSKDELVPVGGESTALAAGQTKTLRFTLPDTGGQPYLDLGLVVSSHHRGTVYLDSLDISGPPDFAFRIPDDANHQWKPNCKLWLKQWVDATDSLNWGDAAKGELFRIAGDGKGSMMLTGGADWTDYEVSTTVTTHLADRVLLAARVRGSRRWYAVALGPEKVVRIIKSRNTETVLAEAPFEWKLYEKYKLTLRVEGDRLRASVTGDAGKPVTLEAQDARQSLTAGGIAIGVDAGRINVFGPQVRPLSK